MPLTLREDPDSSPLGSEPNGIVSSPSTENLVCSGIWSLLPDPAWVPYVTPLHPLYRVIHWRPRPGWVPKLFFCPVHFVRIFIRRANTPWKSLKQIIFPQSSYVSCNSSGYFESFCPARNCWQLVILMGKLSFGITLYCVILLGVVDLFV
jgi:hypothetical protein